MRSLVRIKRLSIRSSGGTETAQSIARQGRCSAAQAGRPDGWRKREIRLQGLLLQRFGNVLFNLAGLGEGRKAVEHLAIASDQKLGEIPLDGIGDAAPAGLRLQILVERMRALAIDLDFGEQRER